LLALSQPSDAKIVYTAVQKVTGKNSSYQLDLNRDGLTDFTIKSSHCSYNPSRRTVLPGRRLEPAFVTPAQNNAVKGSSLGFGLKYAKIFYPATNVGGANNVVKFEAQRVAGSGRFGACTRDGPSPAPRTLGVDLQQRIVRLK
jgi:hypothetical protein